MSFTADDKNLENLRFLRLLFPKPQYGEDILQKAGGFLWENIKKRTS